MLNPGQHSSASTSSKVARRAVRWQVEGQGDAAERGQHVREHPEARGVALDSVEQQGGVGHVPLVQVGNAADLRGRIGAVDTGELAQRVDALDPFAQVVHWHAGARGDQCTGRWLSR